MYKLVDNNETIEFLYAAKKGILSYKTAHSKKKIGETFNTRAYFSNTVTRTSTHTYTIEAAKDVQLGQAASVYSDQNFDNQVLFGINKSTGAIITHFAFYY